MTTILAWLVIVISALLVPISGISLLMILTSGHGTGSITLGGFLSVVVAPPLTLIAGISLLRRRPWARRYLIALLLLLSVFHVRTLLSARPTATTTHSPSGVPTTTLASYPNHHSLPIIVISAAAIAWLLLPATRREFGTKPKNDRAPVGVAPVTPTTPITPSVTGPVAVPQHGSLAAVWVFSAVLLGIAGGLGWMVARAHDNGKVYMISKRSSQQRYVERQQEPALFYLVLGTYTAVALGAAGFSVWFLVVAYREEPSHTPDAG
jgi:hypothetical protein